MTLVIDSELQISHTEDGFFQSLASTTDHLQGSDLTNFVHPDDQAHLRFQVQYCRQNNCTLSSTIRMTIDNGYYAWFQLKAEPLAEPNDQVQLTYSFLQYEEKITVTPKATLKQSQAGTVLFSNDFPPSIPYTSRELGFMRSRSYHHPMDIIREVVNMEEIADDRQAIESALEKVQPLHISYNDQLNGQQYHLLIFCCNIIQFPLLNQIMYRLIFGIKLCSPLLILILSFRSVQMGSLSSTMLKRGP